MYLSHCDNGGFKILTAKYPDKNAFVQVFAARADWDRYALKTQIEEIFDLLPKITEKVIFIQQMQKVNKKLHIFGIANFPISKNEVFIFPLNIYSINSGRFLLQDELKEIGFYSLQDYNGNDDKIIKLESNEEFNDNIRVIFQELKNEDNIKIKLNENNLDTEKVKEEITKGGIDYNNISLDYKIYQYSIISSNEGCEFSLNLKENIKISNNKSVSLSFIEADNHNNKIKAECIISNINKITCKLDKEVNKNYILEPFIYFDKTNTITIFQNFINDYFSLKCTMNDSKNGEGNSSGALSNGALIGIVYGGLGLGVIIIIILVFYIISTKKVNTKNNNDEMLNETIKDKPKINLFIN